MKPTNDEIRKVLAEFMGWTELAEDTMYGEWIGVHPTHGLPELVPDYIHDLNAMHEVEERICASEHSVEYARALYRETRASHVNLISSWGPLWPYIHATAEQRARAAYAVIRAASVK